MNQRTLDTLREIVSTNDCLSPAGSGSKTALRAPEGVTKLSMTNQSGFLEYQPSEYTFTALAGTRLSDAIHILSEHDQFLPFDPPFVDHQATLGGTVAAGLSGSGRYRFGGVRDFLLAVQYMDGHGRLVRAGGKVVKNSAGFDIPKLMVGSLGNYGALIELTFKVFPRPASYVTLRSRWQSIDEALQNLIKLSTNSTELYALDLIPDSNHSDLILRLGGIPQSFPTRIKRLEEPLGDVEILEEDVDLWRIEREFLWLPEDTILIKIPMTPKKVPALDTFLAENHVMRRYTVGANLAWIAWHGPLDVLDTRLVGFGLSGLVLLGHTDRTRIGVRPSESFNRRIKQALDPIGRWLER